MFKRQDDGTYSFSGRFWVQALIMLLLICAIGFSTQRTANKTEELSRETIAYAEQTNDCLNQLLIALDSRIKFNLELDALVGQRASLDDKRFAAWDEFIIGLARISTDLPQSERDRLAAPLVATYLQKIDELRKEGDQINRDRQIAIDKRAENPYPAPNCGRDLPGQ